MASNSIIKSTDRLELTPSPSSPDDNTNEYHLDLLDNNCSILNKNISDYTISDHYLSKHTSFIEEATPPINTVSETNLGQNDYVDFLHRELLNPIDEYACLSTLNNIDTTVYPPQKRPTIHYSRAPTHTAPNPNTSNSTSVDITDFKLVRDSHTRIKSTLQDHAFSQLENEPMATLPKIKKRSKNQKSPISKTFHDEADNNYPKTLQHIKSNTKSTQQNKRSTIYKQTSEPPTTKIKKNTSKSPKKTKITRDTRVKCKICGHVSRSNCSGNIHFDNHYMCPFLICKQHIMLECSYRVLATHINKEHTYEEVGILREKCLHSIDNILVLRSERKTKRSYDKLKTKFCNYVNSKGKYCRHILSFQSQLQPHVQTHTRIKPYDCPYCEHSTSNKYNLNKHIDNVHCNLNKTSRVFDCDFENID